MKCSYISKLHISTKLAVMSVFSGLSKLDNFYIIYFYLCESVRNDLVNLAACPTKE